MKNMENKIREMSIAQLNKILGELPRANIFIQEKQKYMGMIQNQIKYLKHQKKYAG